MAEKRLRATSAVLICSLGLLLASLGQASAAALGSPVRVGEPKPVPDLAFETMDGRPAGLADFAGKVVVLNFWATWCAPCREEMPSLDRLQAAFDPEKVLVVALSVDRAGPERVQAFLTEIGVTRLSVYRDPKASTTRAIKVLGLPATLLLDRQGHEVARILGVAAWDSPEVVQVIRALLEQAPRE